MVKDIYGEERTEKVVAEFRKNEFWREYYDKAPSEICREFITMQFLDSDIGEVEGSDNYYDQIEKKLGKEDWLYLAKYAGNNPWKAKCLRMAKIIHGKQNA